jgi:hypothetical protein
LGRSGGANAVFACRVSAALCRPNSAFLRFSGRPPRKLSRLPMREPSVVLCLGADDGGRARGRASYGLAFGFVFQRRPAIDDRRSTASAGIVENPSRD